MSVRIPKLPGRKGSRRGGPGASDDLRGGQSPRNPSALESLFGRLRHPDDSLQPKQLPANQEFKLGQKAPKTGPPRQVHEAPVIPQPEGTYESIPEGEQRATGTISGGAIAVLLRNPEARPIEVLEIFLQNIDPTAHQFRLLLNARAVTPTLRMAAAGGGYSDPGLLMQQNDVLAFEPIGAPVPSSVSFLIRWRTG